MVAAVAQLAARGVELPDYVKAAAIDGLFDRDRPAGAYADRGRELPRHTKAATWMSAAAVALAPDQFTLSPLEAAKLAEAVRVYGVGPDLPAVEVKTAAAPADGDYVFVRDGDRRCPVRTPREAVKAAEWLDEYRRETTYLERRDAARRLLEKTAGTGWLSPETTSRVEQMAGFGVPDRSAIEGQLFERFLDSGAGEFKLAAETLYLTVRRTPNATLFSADNLEKLAAAVEAYDRDRGVDRRYGERFFPPEKVAYALPASSVVAAMGDLVMAKTGESFSRRDLGRVRPDDVLPIGPDLVRGGVVDTDRLVYALTHNEKIAAMFCSIAPKLGLQPMSSSTVGVDRCRLVEAAARY